MLAGLIGLAAVAAVQGESNRELRLANRKTSGALEAETKAKGAATKALAQSEESRRGRGRAGFLKDVLPTTCSPEARSGGLPAWT